MSLINRAAGWVSFGKNISGSKGESCKCSPRQVSTHSGRVISQFLEHILVGGGDLERGAVNLVV